MSAQIPTASVFSASEEQLDSRPRSLWGDAWSRLRRNRPALVCLGIVILYLAMGLATFLPVFDRRPTAEALATMTEQQREQSLGLIWKTVGESYQPPAIKEANPRLWLGADIQGRSVFWRLIYGTRIALLIVFWASLIAIVIGVTLGIVSGFFGGWIDSAVIWLFSTISSIPWILLTIALTFVIKQSALGETAWWNDLYTVILALGLTGWVGLCRLIRGEVLSLRERDYVTAARAAGLGTGRILGRHILPNVLHLIIITFSLEAVAYVQAEVVLSFLGLGITDKPSWGRMIDDAKLELLRGVWWQFAAATAAIFILCLALNMLGDALRDALDPRLRGVD